jgi:hypothetical protein
MTYDRDIYAPGQFFRHYRGDVYVFIEMGCMESGQTEGMDFAVYKSTRNGLVWIRPMYEFVAPVRNDDGESVPRFAHIKIEAPLAPTPDSEKTYDDSPERETDADDSEVNNE